MDTLQLVHQIHSLVLMAPRRFRTFGIDLVLVEWIISIIMDNQHYYVGVLLW